MNLANRLAARCRSIVIGAGVLALSLSTTVMAAPPDEFSIGSVPSDISSIVPEFAQASGAFAKYGINAHLVTIEGGSRGMQVLLSGKIQGMQGGLSIIVEANREGADLRMVSSSANSSLLDIYVTSNIKTANDLKGKKFAISSFTAETDMAATLALRHWNLTRKDVTVVALGGASQRIAAQLSGQVAASAYPNPSSEIAREKGLVKLLDLGNDGAPWVFNGIVFQHDFIDAHPDIVKRVIKANLEGEYKALSDEAWAKKIIGDAYKTDSKLIIDAAYDQWKRTVARDFALSPVAVKNVIAEVNAMGPALSSMDPSNYVDTRFTDELTKEGFVAQVKKQYGM